MINTLNESSLHRTLKTVYALNDGAQTEVALDGKIYDIVQADGSIVEIQTQNLSKLLAKTMHALEKKRHITVVYPLIVKKYIDSCDANGTVQRHRTSPQKRSLYDIFPELTGIYPVLLEKRFTLEVLEVIVREKRIITDRPVQSANRRRRYAKPWNKVDKSLEKIIARHVFTTAAQYRAFIPSTCLPEFTAQDIARALKADTCLPATACRQAHCMLWVLSHMNLIRQCGVHNRSRVYTVHT